jgi:hypothetical protein
VSVNCSAPLFCFTLWPRCDMGPAVS